jgi:hypothetical protein
MPSPPKTLSLIFGPGARVIPTPQATEAQITRLQEPCGG